MSTLASNADFVSFDFSDGSRSPSPSLDPTTKPHGKKRKASEFLKEDVLLDGSFAGLQKERLTPWMSSCPPLPLTGSIVDVLSNEIQAFVLYASSLPYEQDLRGMTVRWLRKVVKERWRNAELELFGSGKTGTEVPGGDIDLVLLLPNLSSRDTKSTLFALSSVLQSTGICAERPIVIHKARVPIVKFETRYGDYKVDISLNQTNGMTAANMVVKYLDAYRGGGNIVQRPRFPMEEGEKWSPTTHDGVVDLGVARCLVLLVKMFLAQRGMNEVFTGGLGSYSIICMVVSFLQLHPMVQSGQMKPSRNLGILFIEFLELYGKHFNYDDCGISVVEKGGYFSKMQRGWWNERKPTLLSIEDPNDPSNDISSGSYNIIRVRQTFAGAYDVLCASLYQLDSERAAYYDPRVAALEGSSIPKGASSGGTTTPSVLGSIFGLSKKIVEQRKKNLELWNSKTLQKILGEDKQNLDFVGATSRVDLGKAVKEERGKKEKKKERKDKKEKKRDKKEKGTKASSSRILMSSDEAEPGELVEPIGHHISVSDSENDLPVKLDIPMETALESRYTISAATTSKKRRHEYVAASDSSASDGETSDGSLKITPLNSQASIKVTAPVIDLTGTDDDAEVEGESNINKRPESKRPKLSAKDAKKERIEKRNKFWSAKGAGTNASNANSSTEDSEPLIIHD